MAGMGRKPTKNINLPPRMRMRTMRSGAVYYYYDTGAKPRKEIPLGSDYLLAVKKWGELHQDDLPVSAAPTLKDVWDKYQREVLQSKAAGTIKDYNKSIKHILKIFNDPPAPLDEIDPVDIRAYLDWRGKEAQTRANREVALISTLWNSARSWGYTSKANPCSGVKRFKEVGRKIYIEDPVADAVYEAADQPTRDALDLAYLTAQRPGDVAKMYETDIQGGKLSILQGKTGKYLKINVVGELKTIIDRIQQRKSAFKVRSLALIVDEYGKPLSQHAIWKRFDNARAKAAADNPKLKEKIEAFQLRDLRAKGGTDKAVGEKDIRAAQRILGHSNVIMTERYVRELTGDEVDPTK